MAPNIWQTLNPGPEPLISQAALDSLDPKAAAVRAALPDKGAPVSAPMVGLPSAPAPTVTLAPQKPSPQQQQIANDAAKLQKVEWQQANPWGTANNHPGKLGKIAHVFSELGNIAGDIFAPATLTLTGNLLLRLHDSRPVLPENHLLTISHLASSSNHGTPKCQK